MLLSHVPSATKGQANTLTNEGRETHMRASLRRHRHGSQAGIAAVALLAWILVEPTAASAIGTPRSPTQDLSTPRNAKPVVSVSSINVAALPDSQLVAKDDSIQIGLPSETGECQAENVNTLNLKVRRSPEKCETLTFGASRVGVRVDGIGHVDYLDVVTVNAKGDVKNKHLAKISSDSGSEPRTALGPNVLWVYERETSDGPTVWEIEASTGSILRKEHTQPFVNPRLAANRTGLYIAGGGTYGNNGDILHFEADAPVSKWVFRGRNIFGKPASIEWITASNSSVWIGVCGVGTKTCIIAGFSGANFNPLFQRPALNLTESVAAVSPAGVLVLVPTDQPTTSTTGWQVDEINATTGRQSANANIQLSALFINEVTMPSTVVQNNSALWILDIALNRLTRVQFKV